MVGQQGLLGRSHAGAGSRGDRPPDLRGDTRPICGRHDIFFDLEETLSWMNALPRMEAHILDGPHFLLETHPAECAALMSTFVRRVELPNSTPHTDARTSAVPDQSPS